MVTFNSQPDTNNRIVYVQRAQMHRPRDVDELAREIRRLNRTGLKPRDIASALRLNPSAVLEALQSVSTTSQADRY